MKPGTVICGLHFLAPVLAFCAVATIGLHAQVPNPIPQPDFEAVSIHLVDPHNVTDLEHGVGLFSMSEFPTNRFALRNAPLSFLVQFAYDVDSQDHIAAMPGWMEQQEYDVSAKVEGDRQLTLAEMRPMLRRLLEQRFHFATHHETRIVNGFALVVAKGGPRLVPGKPEGKPGAQMFANRIDATNMDLEHFAGVLAHRAGGPIADKTGLAGTFDFRVSFSGPSDTGSNLPDFFTALQEQLGLKLEPQKIPVDFLVVDRVERVPTEN